MIPIALARSYLEVSPEKDDILALDLKAVIAKFESDTRCLWNKRTGVSQVFQVEDPSHRVRLFAVNISVTTVVEWSDAGEETEADAETVTAYTLDHINDYIHALSYREGWDDRVKVTFGCGYTVLPDQFADITQALLMQMKFMRHRNAGDRLIQQSEGMEEGSSTRFKSGPDHEDYKAVVDKYKIVTL